MATFGARHADICGVTVLSSIFTKFGKVVVCLSYCPAFDGCLDTSSILEVPFTAIFNVKCRNAMVILTPMTAKPLLLGGSGTLSSGIFDLFDVDANPLSR